MSVNPSNRLRLKPWLMDKIESRIYPGLRWLDRNQKIFRISWKRNGTSDWAQEDSAIFRDWVVHTGKFREGGVDPVNYPYLKTRFRCALNKHPEIIEQKEMNALDSNDPYKVYRIIDKGTYDEPLPTQEDNEVEMADDFKSPMEMDIGLSLWNPHINLVIHNTKEIFHNTDDLPTGSLDSELKKLNSDDLLLMSPEEFSKLQIDFEVTISFQSEQLNKICVKESCFLTTYDPEFKSNNCQVIKFPEIVPKTEEIQAITSVLWPNMKDGIYIKIDGNKNIFAQRLCKCRIYYRDQNSNDGLKLERSDGRKWSMIFNYQDFLQNYKWGNPKIQADVTLYIGQRGDTNPYNVFYSVTICHLLAKQSLSDRNMRVHNISISI